MGRREADLLSPAAGVSKRFPLLDRLSNSGSTETLLLEVSVL
jgi:hypothetical protein